MKYVIFFAGSLLCVPVGVLLAVSFHRFRDAVFVALVLGTTQPGALFGLPLDINFLSHEWYRGSTRGIEISYLDLLALILLFSSLFVRGREGPRYFWPPSLGLLLAYLFWCCLNVLVFSDPRIFGIFELTKIARGIVIFVAVTAYVRGPREVRLFVWASIVAIGYEAAICLRDRYVIGEHRVSGTLDHPNSLSMYCLQFVPIFIVTMFSVDVSAKLRQAAIVAYFAAAGCIMLSISRTGVAVLILLTGVSIVLCTRLRVTPRNVGLVGLSLVLGSLMLIKSWDTIVLRFSGFDIQREYFTEEGDRGAYFRRGAPAIRDRPVFGVGLNNWSYWISNRYAEEAGYASVPYPSVHTAPMSSHQEPAAHNLFLLTAVELGWPGFFIFVALLLRWLFISGGAVFTRGEQLMERVRLGAFLSLCAVLMQSWTEWEFRQTSMFFLGHVTMGLASVLYFHQTRKARR